VQVLLGVHKVSGKQHALKVVYLQKPTLREKHIAVLQREGVYLRSLQHKNIVKCHKIYQSRKTWVFVLEYLKGGMLLNDLAKVGMPHTFL
jgi:serine/threonine protein kinase